MLGETGADIVMQVIRGSLRSTVSVAECCARRGRADDLNTHELSIRPFDLALALDAARLREPIRQPGVPLGDRACLALAVKHNLLAQTSDRRPAIIDPAPGVAVRLIR